jgi:hypothetical protein
MSACAGFGPWRMTEWTWRLNAPSTATLQFAGPSWDAFRERERAATEEMACGLAAASALIHKMNAQIVGGASRK